MAAMNPWMPERNPKVQRRVGKTGEECAELMKVISRIQIQGIDGVDPESGKSNRECLQEELADVMAQCEECIVFFDFNVGEILKRILRKRAQMAEWESLVVELDLKREGFVS